MTTSKDILQNIHDEVISRYSVCLLHLSVEDLNLLQSYLNKQLYLYEVTRRIEDKE